MKAIVIYFSHSGNTRKAAEYVANALGLDTAQIMPNDSDSNYWAPVEFNPDDYSDYIIGYPIIDGSIPRHFQEFLSSIDWRGRKVYPLCTMGGYLGEVEYQLHKACQGASFRDGLKLKFIDGKCTSFDKDISSWTAYIQRDARLF
ncbi:MAG: hypothetical protein MJ108_03125 [Saccharofermentans sp.]|nr:hypothetical protein [Saccharofermentans sp.]